MTHEEFRQYWVPAANKVVGVYSYRRVSDLDILLGIDEYRDYCDSAAYGFGNNSYKPMSSSLKNLLRQLAGPHGKTILKAYRIKRGLE